MCVGRNLQPIRLYSLPPGCSRGSGTRWDCASGPPHPHPEGPKQYLPPRTSDTVETHAQCASTSQTQWNQVLSPMSAPGEDLLQSPGCQGVLTVPVALPLPVSQRLPLGRGVRLGFNLSLLCTLRNSIIFTDASSAHMGSHREPRAWSKLGQ